MSVYVAWIAEATIKPGRRADFERLIVCSDLPEDMRKELEGINCAYRLPWGGFKK